MHPIDGNMLQQGALVYKTKVDSLMDRSASVCLGTVELSCPLVFREIA